MTSEKVSFSLADLAFWLIIESINEDKFNIIFAQEGHEGALTMNSQKHNMPTQPNSQSLEPKFSLVNSNQAVKCP